MTKEAAEFVGLSEGTRVVCGGVDNACMAMGAVGYSIYKNRKKAREEKEIEEYRENLRNTWGLYEYEIDLVESGEYEPSQFSEEGLEDDDYYED